MRTSASRQNRLGEGARPDWIRFGWQGVSGLTPPDWNIGAIGGDFKQGYLRLDDPERPRLEIKWSKQTVDIGKNLEKYLRSLSKPKRGFNLRRGPEIEIDRDVKIVSQRQKPYKRLENFAWQQGEGYRGAGVMWSCQTCGRTLIAQVRTYGSEDPIALARSIILNLDDHGSDERNTWALYGLECQVPENYTLLTQSLMAGYLELVLQNGRRKLRVCRWGLASTALHDAALGDWMVYTLSRLKKPLRWQAHDILINGHTGVRVEGRTRKVWISAWRAFRSILPRPLGAPKPLDGVGTAWTCAESNRIYLVESTIAPEESLVTEVAESIPCHALGVKPS